ncbi:hypothetical protein HHI36_016066 [Cryptolaemus montrouzieri]|uniref:Tektin n=1 Tax=Cryptolaemus montrouzieri TaxID=559131 RepID=A0ABD2N7N8_9CUCU
MYCTKGEFHSISAVNRPPTMFTSEEWELAHTELIRCSFDQHLLSDSILKESDRLCDMILEKTKFDKAEVDHQLEMRVREIDYYKSEVLGLRKKLLSELEDLGIYINRVRDFRCSIREALEITKKCLIMRDCRVGIDLVHDEVQEALLKELRIQTCSEDMLKRLHEQMNEQLRILRSVLYSADRNLEDKEHALRIDEKNAALHDYSINLSMYHGATPLNVANITIEEWQGHTKKTIDDGLDQLRVSVQIRSLMEALMKQALSDLKQQKDMVNKSFHHKLGQIKEYKTTLEERHSDVTRKCNDLMENIRKLHQAIKNEEPFMALSHTRLGNRAQRRNVELCRDHTETQLTSNVLELRNSVAMLQQLLAQSQASLRYLLKVQLNLEEQINVKHVSIKIDEVECLTLRQKLDYFYY